MNEVLNFIKGNFWGLLSIEGKKELNALIEKVDEPKGKGGKGGKTGNTEQEGSEG